MEKILGWLITVAGMFIAGAVFHNALEMNLLVSHGLAFILGKVLDLTP